MSRVLRRYGGKEQKRLQNISNTSWMKIINNPTQLADRTMHLCISVMLSTLVKDSRKVQKKTVLCMGICVSAGYNEIKKNNKSWRHGENAVSSR